MSCSSISVYLVCKSTTLQSVTLGVRASLQPGGLALQHWVWGRHSKATGGGTWLQRPPPRLPQIKPARPGGLPWSRVHTRFQFLSAKPGKGCTGARSITLFHFSLPGTFRMKEWRTLMQPGEGQSSGGSPDTPNNTSLTPARSLLGAELFYLHLNADCLSVPGYGDQVPIRVRPRLVRAETAKPPGPLVPEASPAACGGRGPG